MNIHGLRKKQFNTMFLLEVWERFAFYGFQSLFILFMTHEKLPEQDAYLVYGIFSALLWGSPVVGGYVADKITGLKRALLLGGVLFFVGYLSIAFAKNLNQVLIALALIATGNGFFKPTPSAVISKIYSDSPMQTKTMMTYYYMSINIGAFVSMTVIPIIQIYTSYNTVFILSSLSILFGLLNYLYRIKLFNNINNKADLTMMSFLGKVKIAVLVALMFMASYTLLKFLNAAFYILIFIYIFVFIHLFKVMKKLPEVADRFRFFVAILLILEMIPFSILYNQTSSSIILLAKNNVDLNFLGFHISPGNVGLFEPLAIIFFSPLVVGFYRFLKKTHYHMTIPTKFFIGQFIASLSMLVLPLAGEHFSHQAHISLLWIILSYFLFGLGELFILALSLSMVGLYFPKTMISFGIGVTFLAMAVGGSLAGKFAEFFASLPKGVSAVQSLTLYTNYFLNLGLISLAISICYFLVAFYINKYSKKLDIVLD